MMNTSHCCKGQEQIFLSCCAACEKKAKITCAFSGYTKCSTDSRLHGQMATSHYVERMMKCSGGDICERSIAEYNVPIPGGEGRHNTSD